MDYAHVVLERIETIKLRVTGCAGKLDWDCRLSFNFAGGRKRIPRSYFMTLSVHGELAGRHKPLRAFRRFTLVVTLGCQMLNKCSILLETLLA